MVLKIILLFIISFSAYAIQNSEITSTIREKTSDTVSKSLEVDFKPDSAYVSPKVEYSTHSKLNLALSVNNIHVAGEHTSSRENVVYFSVSKFFKLDDHFAMVLGTKNGLLLDHKKQWLTFNFADFRFRPIKGIVFHAGPYYANSAMTRESSQIGVESGVELYNDKFTFNFDYINRNSSVSGGSATLSYKVSSKFSVYGGVGIPDEFRGDYNGVLGVKYSMGL